MMEALIILLGTIFYIICVLLTASIYCKKNVNPSFWSVLFMIVPPLNVFTAFFGLKSLIRNMGFKGIFIKPFTDFIKQVVVEEKPKYRP